MQAYAQKECQYIAMKGRALLEMTRGAPVILNPGSEYGREFTAAEIARLLEPNVPRAEPLRQPAGIAAALAAGQCAVATCSTCAAMSVMAWMIQARTTMTEPMPLVGIQTIRRHAAS